MKYLRIKPCFDQKARSDGSILIGRELYTKREARQFAIPSECYDVVAKEVAELFGNYSYSVIEQKGFYMIYAQEGLK